MNLKQPATSMIHLFLSTFTWQIELQQTKSGKFGFTIGFGQAPRLRDLDARDLAGLVKEIRMAKERFGLPESAPVRSCYRGRAGRVLVAPLPADTRS